MAAKAILPKYTRPKRLKAGGVAYYWEPPTWAKKRECRIVAEPLGTDLAQAVARANMLNKSFDNWRTGKPGGPAPGSVDRLVDWYQRHPRYLKLKPKTKRSYDQCLTLLANIELKTVRLGEVRAHKIEPKHADEIYRRIQWVGERHRLATANAVMRVAQAMWKLALRAGHVKQNPFTAMGLEQTGGHTVAATRDQVYTFVAKADEMGYPAMGTATVLAFELCQREGDVIGTIAWNDYRPGDSIHVRQAKTNELVWLPLRDEDGRLYPEVEDRLEATPKRGTLLVMRDQIDIRSKTYLPYSEHLVRKHFRKIREAAVLPDSFTFMSLRHGGLTELGEAGATDSEMMAISGHKTRGILTVYSKQTPQQAANAARKRRAWRTKQGVLSE